MCGIFGGVGADTKEVRACLENILRGNDGITVEQYGSVVLGGRRHLVKVSDKPGVPAGHSDQPYHSDDGTVHLVFNGELYNFADLRDEMIGQGRSFDTVGDTEVFLGLYERDGEAFLE